MHNYYDIFVGADNPHYKYSQADHSGYEAPEGFVDIANGLDAEGRARVSDLKGLKPSV